MTIVECLSVAGNVIPPFIILADNAHLDDSKHDIQPGWKLAFSLNGFVSDALAMEWLHHFDMSTCNRARNQYRLLLVNNFGIHITEQFLQFRTSVSASRWQACPVVEMGARQSTLAQEFWREFATAFHDRT